MGLFDGPDSDSASDIGSVIDFVIGSVFGLVSVGAYNANSGPGAPASAAAAARD